MKIKNFILFFFFALSFFSCRESFDWATARGEVAKEEKKQEYALAFAEEFGIYGVLNIDSSHNWGFVDIPQDTTIYNETRSAQVNANQWFDFGLDVPKPLTDIQKQVVTEWFSTHQNPNGIAVNWTEYFAQQVSSTNYGRHMDYLLDAGHGGTDHVNNFNSGDCSNTNVGNIYQDKIMFMSGQSTKDFAYHETVSDKTWYDHYVIIPGEIIDPSNTYGLWGMYFVGFDYEAYKYEGSWDNVSRDYYFNDWIIKISPGLLTKPEPVRIMAEDLGMIGDFDFNDVVFDVYIKYNEYWHGNDYAIVVLQAAGGTMPLYVDKHEVHEEFGVPTTQMVNTGNGSAQTNVVSRPIVVWSFTPKSANPKDIVIHVDNTKENLSYDIDYQVGKAPGKIAMPTTVNWSPECVNIKTTYPKFTQWVEDQNIKFWE